MHILSPGYWKNPKGYSPGISTCGRMVFVSGMVGWNAVQQFETRDFLGQAHQTLKNITVVLAEGGAKPAHLVRLTWFVTDLTAYRLTRVSLGEVYRKVIGDHYPTMSVVEVSALLEPCALLEIEATAIVPDE